MCCSAALQNLFLGTQMYLASMIFIKSAILLEWARIFGPSSRSTFRLTCYALAVVNAIYYTINISLEVTSCRPRAYYWDKTIPGGKCVYNGPALSLTSALINLLFDLAILLLPQGVIWKLNMSRRKRVGVSAVFIVGLGYVFLHAPIFLPECPIGPRSDQYHQIVLAHWGLSDN